MVDEDDVKERRRKSKKNKKHRKSKDQDLSPVKKHKVEENKDMTVNRAGELPRQHKVKAVSSERNLLPDTDITLNGGEIKRKKKRKASSGQAKMSAEVRQAYAVVEVDEGMRDKANRNLFNTEDSSQTQVTQGCAENLGLGYVEESKRSKKKKKKGKVKDVEQHSYIQRLDNETGKRQTVTENAHVRQTIKSKNEFEFASCDIVEDNETTKFKDGTKRKKRKKEEISSPTDNVFHNNDNNSITKDNEKSAKKIKKSRKKYSDVVNNLVSDERNSDTQRLTDEFLKERAESFKKLKESDNEVEVTSCDTLKDKGKAKSKDRGTKEKRKRQEISCAIEGAIDDGDNDCLMEDRENFTKKRKKSKKKGSDFRNEYLLNDLVT